MKRKCFLNSKNKILSLLLFLFLRQIAPYLFLKKEENWLFSVSTFFKEVQANNIKNFISDFFLVKFQNKKIFFVKSTNKCTQNYLSKITYVSAFFKRSVLLTFIKNGKLTFFYKYFFRLYLNTLFKIYKSNLKKKTLKKCFFP